MQNILDHCCLPSKLQLIQRVVVKVGDASLLLPPRAIYNSRVAPFGYNTVERVENELIIP
jgi:hypothetical protein